MGYVGYNDEFSFEGANHELFRDVVNASVLAYVGGTSAKLVKSDLANDWDRLRHDFLVGRYASRPNFLMAAQRAADNCLRVEALM